MPSAGTAAWHFEPRATRERAAALVVPLLPFVCVALALVPLTGRWPRVGSGGCFHSRTAMGMFDHVREAVDRGDCLLEWDYTQGKPPAPLLKDVFGSERRRAKTLNFSIAYGKTVHGLSKDWGAWVRTEPDGP